VFGIDRIIADALNAAHGVVALSRHARRIMESMGVDKPKIVDIPNGVDTERFRRSVDFSLRRRFGLPEHAVVILSVGREVWAKGYDTGIRAFAQACKGTSNVFYLILGRGVGRWEGLSRDSIGPGRVIFCDGLYDDQLVGAYQQADVFLLPSVKETFPLVLLEAMAAGLPAVVTDVSGSQDVIVSEHNGFVVPPGGVEQMAVAIRRLVDDRALRQRFGEVNREKSELYRWDRISRLYLEHA
jgi:glycosyltransferase involved in cell wall biosynthesis